MNTYVYAQHCNRSGIVIPQPETRQEQRSDDYLALSIGDAADMAWRGFMRPPSNSDAIYDYQMGLAVLKYRELGSPLAVHILNKMQKSGPPHEAGCQRPSPKPDSQNIANPETQRRLNNLANMATKFIRQNLQE